MRLTDFTKAGILTLNPGEGPLNFAVIDTTNGFAYFGAGTKPGAVVKVRLSDFKRVAAVTFNAGEDYTYRGVIDPSAGFAYFGTSTKP